MRRLLLVELAASGRFLSGWGFPFVHGFARAAGVDSRWLRFAIDVTEVGRHGNGTASLEPRDLDRLASAVREASHILFSALPSPALLESLHRARPGAETAVLGQTPAAGDGRTLAVGGVLVDAKGIGIETLAFAVDPIRRWLSLADTGGPADIFAAPDYGYEPANERAASETPAVTLIAGRSCTYQTRLRALPFFAERGGLGLPERWGCSFCPVPAWDRQADPALATPAELVRRQLEAVARTHPKTDAPLRFKLSGAALALEPRALARLIAESGVAPSAFLLDYRADEIVRLAGEIEEAAEQLAGSGHTLNVCLVGIESFSARQLDRYAKGYAPEINLEAVRVLRRLEHDNPAGFVFREHGGLSTILYDPWASPADVAITLATVEKSGLADLCGKLFGSRIRLTEGLPLAGAARRDGLLVEAYDDPLLDTSRWNFYPDELPWRFADSRMEPLCRVLIRFSRDRHVLDDRLGQAVHARIASSGQSAIRCALRLCQAAVAHTEPLPIDTLAGTIDRPAATEQLSTSPGLDDATFAARWDVAAFDAGRKPVVKVELQSSEAKAVATQEELASRWPDATVELRASRKIGDPMWELFAGHDAAAMRRAQELTVEIEKEMDPERLAGATTELGVLLGYPRCCAAAFAAEPRALRDNNEWLRLARRIEAPDAVDPLYNPVVTGFIPCSLACAASLALSRQVRPDEPAAMPDGWQSYPTLLFLDRPGEFAIFEVTGERGAELDIELVAWRTADPRLPQLRRANRLVIEPGLVRVVQDGRDTAFFALDAFLWWSERVFHASFWRALLRGVTEPVSAGAASPGETRFAGCDAREPRLRLALKERMRVVLDNLAQHPKRYLRGFETERIDSAGGSGAWGELVVALRRGNERLRLRFRPRGAEPHAFAEEEQFAVVYDRAAPADTLEKRRILRVVLRAFERSAATLVREARP